jgi:arylsulfatase A-like enzyme
MRRTAVALLSTAAAVLASTPRVPIRTEQAVPAVLLISVDTLRADHLGVLGSGRSLTPNMDRLAKEGRLFRRAYSVANVTQPALASLLSGLYPSQHGHDSNLATTNLPKGRPLLTELLRARGLETAAFMAHPWIFYARYGMDRGFDHWDGVDYRSTPAGEFNISEEEYLRISSAGPMTDRVLAWLGPARSRPFFIWVHYLDPHDPYTPPVDAVPSGPPAEPTGNPEWDRQRRLYAGEVAHLDRHVGRLIRAARAAAPAGRLVVVLTADHGEMLYDHEGFPTHGLYTYDSEIRVPLVLAGPGVQGGSVIDAPASMVDVAPTLLQLVGAEVPTGLPGVDLLAPDQSRRTARRLIVAESEYYRGPDFDGSFGRRCAKDGGKWYTVIGPDFKLVYYPWTDALGYRTEFFEIDDHRQLAPQTAPPALRKVLVEQIALHASGRGTAAPEVTDDSQRAALRTLGYIK